MTQDTLTLPTIHACTRRMSTFSYIKCNSFGTNELEIILTGVTCSLNMKFVIVCNLYLDTFSNLYTLGRSFGRSYPKHILCKLNCYYHIPEMKIGELFSCSVSIIQKTYAE